MKNNNIKILEGDIKKVIISMTLPMIIGMLAMSIFNLTDTFFISRIGKIELAAISLTFPVVMMVNSFVIGISIGVSTLVSRAFGANEHEKGKRYASDALILAIILVIILIILGLNTMDVLFSAIGADRTTLPIIKEYMSIWYYGVIFVVFPMVGNGILRSLGEVKIPGYVMAIGAITNMILDPLLIFGIGIFPELGVKGAALATLIGRAFSFCVVVWALTYKYKIVSFKGISIKEILQSWKKIFSIGIPNSLAKMLIPFSSGIVMASVAVYGTDVIAGFGIATKIEMFSLLFVNALGSVMGPIIGQNIGAKKHDRILEGIKYSNKLCIISGIITCGVLVLIKTPIVKLFTISPEVIAVFKTYIWIVPITYGLESIALVANGILNAFQKPLLAASIALIQMGVQVILLSAFKTMGYDKIFIIMALSYAIAGLVAVLTTKKQALH